MRPCRRWKLGLPSGPKDTTSPSRIASWEPSARPELAQLRVARRDVAPVAARQPQPAALDVAERPHAVPLDLVAPSGRRRAGASPGAGEHRLELLRHRLAIRVLGRIHPVDHPVLAAGAEQDVAALEPLAVEGDHHLVVAELVQLVGPAVPDAHRPGAVVALRDLALELEVLERVVLRAHREVVALGVRRDALRAPPTTPACPRARGADPSAARGRGAPGRRSAAPACARPRRERGSGVASKSRLAR